MTTKVLVTGSTGYLGSRMVAALLEQGLAVRRATHRMTPVPLLGAIETIEGDITDSRFWERGIRECGVIVHLAAQTSTYAANADPIRDAELNVRPMFLMLEACRRSETVPLVVFAGSATQAGLTDQLPVDEKVSDRPVTIYDLHKLQAEQALLYYHRMGFVRGVSLRLANVYGPGPTPVTKDRGILNLMIRRAIRGEDLTLYGNGEFVRDYVFIDDVVAAFLATIAHVGAVGGRHFIVGSGSGHTVAEAIRLVAVTAERRLGRQANVVHVPMPENASPIEARNFVADSRALRDVTGWTAAVTLEEGIDRTFAAFEAEQVRAREETA